jgi:ketosteroid isomerase-like protein
MKSVVRLLPLLPVITSPGCQPSQADIQNQAFESLISAERAFAATSVATDTRTAFLANFAPDGVVFDDGPVNAGSVWEHRPAGGPILSWGPEIADVSAAGDMGYTSGPYEVRMTPDEDAVAWGHFVSVWRRDGDGTWRVAADGGVMHGPATLSPDSVVERAGGGTQRSVPLDDEGIDAAGPALLKVDSEYSRSVAEHGFTASMDDFVDQSARFYRNGQLPFVGKETIVSAASVTETVWTDSEIRAAIVSDAGDLGCTYGVVQARPALGAENTQLHASYYRIWKQDANSIWRVVVDVLIPIPPAND